MGIRDSEKHLISIPFVYAHSARIEDELYNQRSMTETVSSSVTRSYGSAVQVCEWYRESANSF